MNRVIFGIMRRAVNEGGRSVSWTYDGRTKLTTLYTSLFTV